MQVAGLDPEPSERPAETTRVLGPRPESPFAPWDEESTVIYDVVTGTEQNLGPGGIAWFSPDGTMAAWIAGADPDSGGEVRLLDLDTGAQVSLGAGRLVRFEDDEHVLVILPGAGGGEIVDLRTREREPAGVDGSEFHPPMYDAIVRGTHPDYLLEAQPLTEHPAESGAYLFSLSARQSGDLLLHFEAFRAALAGPDEIMVATIPEDGRLNLYAVTISDGSAEYVATASGAIGAFSLAANGRHVFWTDDVCNLDGQAMQMYDRSTDTLTAIDISAVGEEHRYNLRFIDGITPAGLLALGSFGARTLIEPETLEYVVVLPEGFGDVHWSPDYRYASVGQFGGHGGRCA